MIFTDRESKQIYCFSFLVKTKIVQGVILVLLTDRLIDLFIQLCLQGNGRLSAKKRESHFSFLTDDELARLEDAVRFSYNSDKS